MFHGNSHSRGQKCSGADLSRIKRRVSDDNDPTSQRVSDLHADPFYRRRLDVGRADSGHGLMQRKCTRA